MTQRDKRPIISLATGQVVPEPVLPAPAALSPIEKVAVPDKFREPFEQLRDSYRIIEMRIIAAKVHGGLHLLGGEIQFSDTPIDQWRKWDQCFENEEIVVLNDVTVLSDWESIFSSLASGVLDFKGKKVIVRHPPDGDQSVTPQPSVSEPKSRGPGGEIADEQVALSWVLCKPEDEFTAPWCERLERRLTKKAFDSLRELLTQFISGHEGGRGRARRLDIVAPLPFRVSMKAGNDAVTLEAHVRDCVKTENVGFTLKFIEGNDWDGKTLGSVPFHVREWQPEVSGFCAKATQTIPKCDKVQLSVSYRGERLTKTTIDLTSVAMGMPRWHQQTAALPTLPADAADFNDGKERSITFLDLDVAGHTELMKVDGPRTSAALDELRHIFEREVRTNGGRMSWTGDGGTAFFVGGGRSERAVRAAMKTFLDSQAAFVSEPGKLVDLPLRAALDWGSTTWHDDTSGIHCDALNWAAHAQKGAGPPPRLSLSDEVIAELPRPLQSAFVKAGEFENREFHNWRLLTGGGYLDHRPSKATLSAPATEARAEPLASATADVPTRGQVSSHSSLVVSARSDRPLQIEDIIHPNRKERSPSLMVPLAITNESQEPNSLRALTLSGEVQFPRRPGDLAPFPLVGRPVLYLRDAKTTAILDLPLKVAAADTVRCQAYFSFPRDGWEGLSGTKPGEKLLALRLKLVDIFDRMREVDLVLPEAAPE